MTGQEFTPDTGRLETPPGRVMADPARRVIAWGWPTPQRAVDAYDTVLNASDRVIEQFRIMTDYAETWWPVVKSLGEAMDRGRWVTVEQIELYVVTHEMKVFGDRATDTARQPGEVRDRDVARVEQMARHRKEHGPGGLITPGDPQWNNPGDVTNPGRPTKQTALGAPIQKRHRIK